MVRPAILYLLLLLSLPVAAQDEDPVIDSLILALEKQPNDTSKVNTLILLGTQYLTLNNNESVYYGKDALELAEELEFKTGQAYALKLLGQGYAQLGNFQEADTRFKESLAIFEEIGSRDGISNILSNLGSIYFLFGDDSKSIEYHLQALKVAEEIDNKLRIATSLNNIGSVYANKRDTYIDALKYYHRALPIFEQIDNVTGVSFASGNIGEIYFKQGLYNTARPYFERALEIDRGTTYSIFSLSHLGSIYAEQGEFEKAFEFHFEAVDIAESQNARQDLAQSLLMLAKSWEKRGNYLKSIEAYRRALKISEELKIRQEMRLAYEGLALAYARLGDFKNAYTYESLFTKMKDTLYNTDEAKKIQALQFSFDIGKKESEIGLLTKDKELQQATIQRQRIMNWAAGITGFLLLLVVGGIFNRYKYVKRTNKIIQTERDRSKELLLNILPEETARELETSGHAKTRYYESVTVLFTDFKGFSTIAGKLRPQELVSELNDYFMAFDEIVERYGLEKIKTIGDAYMCAGGIPVPNDTHALDAVEAALAMQAYMKRKYKELEESGSQGWELRVGIHTGPIVAGVVGKKKYAYDIWGDTVNIASRMESNGEPGKVNVSSATHALIKDKFECHHRGKISAKNIGEVDMYFIEQEIVPAIAATG
jgi:adenylate cyclase